MIYASCRGRLNHNGTSCRTMSYLQEIAEHGLRAALSPREFAALFGRSPTWSYRLAYEGTIKVIKLHGVMMIPVGEIQRLNDTAHVHKKRLREETIQSEEADHA